jgi:hypothetical protein
VIFTRQNVPSRREPDGPTPHPCYLSIISSHEDERTHLLVPLLGQPYHPEVAAPSCLALLGGHRVDIARDKRHLLAPAFGALQFQCFMLGDGLSALKLLPAFIATILVGRHGLNPEGAPAVEKDNLRPVAYLGKMAQLKRWLFLSTAITASSALRCLRMSGHRSDYENRMVGFGVCAM